MKLKNNKLTSMLAGMMLIAAMAFTAVGCGNKAEAPADNQPATEIKAEANTEVAVVEGTETALVTEESTEVDVIELGEGSVKFGFVVVDGDGNETDYVIHTDAETVGDALLEQNLIEGDDSEYGLYVKTVNGVTADYDTDGTYWAFYINDEYASTGVDATPVTDGDTYMFRVEK